jgi:predicted nucleotidyltransferase
MNKNAAIGLNQNEINQIINCAQKFPEIEKLAVFGSRTSTNHQKYSDLDLCLFGKNLTSEIRSQFIDEIEENTLIPYSFDIVIYEKIQNPIFKTQIDQNHKIIFQSKT